MQDKIRLLQWKAWTDLAMYASRRSPALLLDEITDYHPKVKPTSSAKAETDPWPALFTRAFNNLEDGHACKALRALRHGQDASTRDGHDRRDDFKLKRDMWAQIGNMSMYCSVLILLSFPHP